MKELNRKQRRALGMLSPSSSDKWLVCFGYLLMQQLHPELWESTDTIHSATGTVKHELAREVLEDGLDLAGELGKERACGEFKIKITPEVIGEVETAVSYAREIIGKYKDATVLYEETVTLDERIVGTADLIVIPKDPSLFIDVDFKFGHRSVNPNTSTQLKLYDAATARQFNLNARRGEIYIIQPRDYNNVVKKAVITPKERLEFYITVLHAIEEALKPKPRFTTGDHCIFCPAKLVCPAQIERQKHLVTDLPLETSDVSGVAESKLPAPFFSTRSRVEFFLRHKKQIQILIKCLERAEELAAEWVKKGEPIEGTALETKVSRRFWRHGIDYTAKVLHEEFGIALYEQKPKSPAQVEKEVGKGVIDKLTFKGKTKPKLIYRGPEEI